MTVNKTLLLRFGLALLSSGVLSFLSQIAVFVYTRSINAPIPAGEILGLSAGTFSVVLGFIWALTIFTLIIINNGWSVFSHLKSNDDLSTIDFGNLSRNLLYWGFLPLFAVIGVSIALVFCSPCTAKVLNFLGYGGGLDVCVFKEYDSTSKQANKPVTTKLVLISENYVYTRKPARTYGYYREPHSNISIWCDEKMIN